MGGFKSKPQPDTASQQNSQDSSAVPQEKEQPKGILFGKPAEGNPFGQKVNQEEKKAPLGEVFGKKNSPQANEEQKQSQPSEGPKPAGGLFGGQPKTGGLALGQAKPEEEKKQGGA